MMMLGGILRPCTRTRNLQNVFVTRYQSTKRKRSEHLERMTRYSGEFPEKLISKKQKTASHMYVANAQIAQQIDDYLGPHFQQSKCDTILEVNPGPGHFTRKLLDRENQFRKIILVEQMDYFMPGLQELHALYPDRVKVRQGDFVGLGKLAFIDKMDGGTRVADLLSDVPQRDFNEGRVKITFLETDII